MTEEQETATEELTVPWNSRNSFVLTADDMGSEVAARTVRNVVTTKGSLKNA